MVCRIAIFAALWAGLALVGADAQDKGAQEAPPSADPFVGTWKAAPKAKEKFELTISADRVSYNFSDNKRSALANRHPFKLGSEGGKVFLELKSTPFDKPTDLRRLYVSVDGDTLSVTIPKEALLAGTYKLQRAKAP